MSTGTSAAALSVHVAATAVVLFAAAVSADWCVLTAAVHSASFGTLTMSNVADQLWCFVGISILAGDSMQSLGSYVNVVCTFLVFIGNPRYGTILCASCLCR